MENKNCNTCSGYKYSSTPSTSNFHEKELKSWDSNDKTNLCKHQNYRCHDDCYLNQLKEMATFLENEANRLQKKADSLWTEYNCLKNSQSPPCKY